MKRDHYFSNAQYFELIWSKTVLIVSILNTKRSDICDFSPFVATQQKKKCICHHLLHFNLTGLHCKSTNTSIILSTSPSPSHNAESSICCWSFVRDWSSSQHCSSEKNTKQSKICLIVPQLWRQCVTGIPVGCGRSTRSNHRIGGRFNVPSVQ